MLLGKFKVSGHSMEPKIKSGQEILVSSVPFIFKSPKFGDIVAFKHSDKLIVKRLKKIEENKFMVQGDNKSDSKDFGWIGKEKIAGKVIYIIPS